MDSYKFNRHISALKKIEKDMAKQQIRERNSPDYIARQKAKLEADYAAAVKKLNERRSAAVRQDLTLSH